MAKKDRDEPTAPEPPPTEPPQQPESSTSTGPGEANTPPDDDDDDEAAQGIADRLVRALAREVSDKDIRQFLVELTKARATQMLNTLSDNEKDGINLLLCGTSPYQILVVRRWLSSVAVPTILTAYTDFMDDKKTDKNTGDEKAGEA